MPFKKGQSGNPNGRPKSTFRKELREGLEDRLPDLWKNLDGLTGKDWLDAFTKIAPYAFPKLSNIEVGADKDKGGIEIKFVNASPGTES